MKTWEMIKELTENPEKKFRIKNGERETYVTMRKGDGCNVIIWQGEYQSGQKFAVTDGKEEWEEVKQPVPWQEAIEAWANGHTVECHLNNYEIKYKGDYLAGQNLNVMRKSEILTGTWYILDREETK